MITLRLVSIPNGDKHDFKTFAMDFIPDTYPVSIPNGDKHDFKTYDHDDERCAGTFQSPMGISTISKPVCAASRRASGCRFNPQWG